MTTQESSIRGKEKPAKMAWLFLLAAGLVEVAFALSIEPTKCFTRPLQTALCFVLGAGSIYLLTQALKTLPIGTAYAVFTGIGAVGTVVLGIVLAGAPATPGGGGACGPRVPGVGAPP